MKNHCIVCAASDCDVVKENEQLKKLNKILWTDNQRLTKVEGIKFMKKYKLLKQIEQLKEIIKTVFDYSESDVWKKDNYVLYTPDEKKLIINILEDK